MKTVLAFVAVCLGAAAADFPSAEISNGSVHMKFYLPDAKQGSYRGTRFDWAGIAYSIAWQQHEFAGRWYPKHDPLIHDALTGPVEEFVMPNLSAQGYEEAQAGGTFLRIGVGTVRKPAGEAKYNRFKTYEVVDPGRWTVKTKKDSISFTQELKTDLGYAYRYTKTVRLDASKPSFTIEHKLQNTGKQAIDTDQYNHNFFVIDGTTIGPGVSIVFPFEPKAQEDLKGIAELRGHSLEYVRELNPGGESVATPIAGFGPDARDYDFRIENHKAGAGVRIRGDQPLARVYFWSIRTVACPEPYIHLHAEPGKTIAWSITYDLYSVPQR